MKKYIIVLIIAGLNLTACTTLKKSTSSTASIEPDVFQYPTVVDLEVGDKIEKTETWYFNPFDKQKLKDREGNLIADMVKSEKADVLLEAQSTYTKVPFGERTLTVSGYPAKYKDFRNATEEDIKAFRKLNGTDCENHNCNVSQTSAAGNIQTKAKVRKKMTLNTGREFVARLGYADNGSIGTGLVNQGGYTLGCEMNSYIKNNFYWNTGIDFSSKGYEYEPSYNDNEYIEVRTHALQIPLGIGYRLNFAKNFGVALNTSMLFSFDLTGTAEYRDYDYYGNFQSTTMSLKDYDDNYSVFDFGFNIRMDIWISKIKLEVAYKPYLAKVCGRKFQSLSFGLGYAF